MGEVERRRAGVQVPAAAGRCHGAQTGHGLKRLRYATTPAGCSDDTALCGARRRLPRLAWPPDLVGTRPAKGRAAGAKRGRQGADTARPRRARPSASPSTTRSLATSHGSGGCRREGDGRERRRGSRPPWRWSVGP
ncbi:unnamed protein product [Urochloa humidicola]